MILEGLVRVVIRFFDCGCLGKVMDVSYRNLIKGGFLANTKFGMGMWFYLSASVNDSNPCH